MTDQTITGIADTTDGFDILSLLLDATGLDATLDDPAADLTVFAPTDAAFTQLAVDLGFDGDTEDTSAVSAFILTTFETLGNGDAVPALTQILLTHVLAGADTFDDISAGGTATTLQGATLTVAGTTLIDEDPDFPDPTVETADIEATNGFVHVIDAVLFPVDLPESNGQDLVSFLVGTDERDGIRGGPDNDVVLGLGGNDRLGGGFGDDQVFGGTGNDRILGREGDDVLLGEDGNDRIKGGHGDDLLDGGDGNDVIRGTRGQDILIGGDGNDAMKGGRDADTFVLRANDGDDVIFDFRPREGDVLDVSDLGIETVAEFQEASVQAGRHILFTDDFGATTLIRKTLLDDLTDADFLFA